MLQQPQAQEQQGAHGERRQRRPDQELRQQAIEPVVAVIVPFVGVHRDRSGFGDVQPAHDPIHLFADLVHLDLKVAGNLGVMDLVTPQSDHRRVGFRLSDGQFCHSAIQPVDLLVDPAEVAQHEALGFIAHAGTMMPDAGRVHRSGVGDVQPAFDPLHLAVEAVEPGLKMGALLDIVTPVTDQPAEFRLDAGQTPAMLGLCLFHPLQALVDPAEVHKDQVVGFIAHAGNMAMSPGGVQRRGASS